jgi:transmembrane sensor
MTEVNAQDQCAAEEWAVRMLDDPGRHQHDLGEWIAAKPGRGALYDRLMRDLDDATAAVRVAPVRSHRPARMRSRKTLLAVAFLCACLAIGFSLRFTALQSAEPLARPMVHLATKVGELRRLTLADGSSVILDTDTLLTTDFSGQRRLLTLKHGRARFSVAHDRARPFVVQAGGGEIVATGTVFDVAYRDALSVDLLQGRVVVRPPNTSLGPHFSPPIALNSGQHIAFDPGHRRPPSVTATSVFETQWVQGTKSLNDVPIDAVIAEANRYATTPIELADSSLGSREIFGDINIRDSDAVAEGIAAYLDLRIDRSQRGKVVLRNK